MNLGKDGVQKELRKNTSGRQKKKSRSAFATICMFLIGLLLCICLMASIGIGMIKGIIDDAPRISNEDVIPDEQMSMIYDANGNLLETLVQAGSHRKNVKDYDSVPEDLINAFVAVEDSRFWEHNGIDPKGIVRAGIQGITSGFRFSQGASTITQQLIKNNVFTDWLSEDSLGDRLERKIQEQYLALQLEEDLTAEKGKQQAKEEILLSYLNTINLGSNTLGIAIASERYFGKDYSELSLSECVVLAAITNNPSAYNPITNPEKNRKRVEKIFSDMVEQGYITEEEKAEALEDDVYTRIQAHNETYTATQDSPNSYFVDAVIEQVSEDLQEERGYTQAQANHLLYSGGLQIYTTMEPAIQKIIDEEINDESHYPDALRKYSCTFTLQVTLADDTTETYTENDLNQYFRKQNSTFKLIGDSRDDLMDYIEEFAAAKADKSNGESWELTSINYTLQPQVSFVIMDQSNGHVLGIAGGRGEKTSDLSLNRATNTTRQPGSLFKVLAGFTPALDTCGDTLSTVYYDGPYSVGEKEFSNYWSSGYTGYSSIRQSIVYSMNIVSVKCLNETVTPALAFEYLENYGFTTLVESRTDSNGKTYSDINASLSLGGLTDGVTNLETTAAYAAIANGGTYTEPVFYTRILDSDGNIVIDNTPDTHTVMKKTTAYLLTDAMEEVMDGKRYPSSGNINLTGTGKRADVEGMSIAGKTGTTSSNYDIWFAGFSPYYTAVLWSGYDELQNLKGNDNSYYNLNYHKEIWKTIMTRVHEDLPDPGFKAPSGIVSRQVCKKSGKLAVSGVCNHDPRGNMIYTEYFAEGSEPTEVCDKHVGVTVCNESGLRATDKCPNTSTKVFMSLDSSATGTSDDSQYALGKIGTCKVDHVAASIEASKSEAESIEASKKAEEESKKDSENSKENGQDEEHKPDDDHGGDNNDMENNGD
ncbi:MAG: transglycosylase domain-containing protein [Lachnospiraceae bacterium]|nr:transglycosylase domain-containing protein [Lachnospiraceae bacterium]